MKRLAWIASILAVLSFAVLAKPSPVQASASDCGQQRVCVWDANNQSGFPIWTSNAGPGTCVNLSVSTRNRANSFRNHLLQNPNDPNGYHFQAYSGLNCSGHLLHKAFGGQGPFQREDVANFDINDQNDLESIFMNTG